MSQRLVITGLVALVGAAQADVVVGSEAIDRNVYDSSGALSLIYRGTTQPLEGNGDYASMFTFYSNSRVGSWITPFLLEVTGEGAYTVVAIGTSRQAGGTGVESFSFSAIAGDAQTMAGHQYTFGYQNKRYVAGETGGVMGVDGTGNTGAIPFTGYNDFSDPWSYTVQDVSLQVGLVYGSGGVALDTFGFTGRIYSANMSFGVIPTPGTAVLAGAGSLLAARRRR